jgi:serine protease Do
MNSGRRLAAALALAAFAASAAVAQDPPAERLRKQMQEAARKGVAAFAFVGGGSGVFISEEGHVLTNHHVAGAAAETVTVLLPDGSRFPARKLGTDPIGDLSLFLLEEAKGRKFAFLEFADSDALEPGDHVVAIGNPFNLASFPTSGRHEPAVSWGIVSALHRRQGGYSDCIQTDAALNPGNSGGPLVDLDGRLVGVNGRIATRFANRVNSGVGYAIPSNQIRRFLPKLKAGEGSEKVVYHGMIGGLEVSPEHTDGLGAVVARVGEGSAAHHARLRAGDRIMELDGRKIHSRDRFLGLLGTYPEGEEVTLEVARGGERFRTKVRLERMGQFDLGVRPRGSGYLGVLFTDIPGVGGVALADVSKDSPAERAGLQVGDRIVEMDGIAYESTEGLLRALWKKKPGETIKLLVERESGRFEAEIDLAVHPADK